MAEPENQTLRILREVRTAIQRLEQKVDQNQDDLRSRLNNIQQAMTGESVLGRYAAAEVDERLEALEKRIQALEGSR